MSLDTVSVDVNSSELSEMQHFAQLGENQVRAMQAKHFAATRLLFPTDSFSAVGTGPNSITGQPT